MAAPTSIRVTFTSPIGRSTSRPARSSSRHLSQSRLHSAPRHVRENPRRRRRPAQRAARSAERRARDPRAIPGRRRGRGQQGDACARSRPASRRATFGSSKRGLARRTRHHRGTAEGLRRDGSEAAVGTSGAALAESPASADQAPSAAATPGSQELARCQSSSSTGRSSRWSSRSSS